MKNLILSFMFITVSVPVLVRAQSGNDVDGAMPSSTSGSDTAGAGTGAVAQAVEAPPPIPVEVIYTSNMGKSLVQGTTASVKSCQSAASSARAACLASISPSIQTAAGLIGGILGTLGMAKSTSESCSKYNKAMDIAQKALMAYNALCTAMQATCESSCTETTTRLKNDRTTLTNSKMADETQATQLEMASVLAPGAAEAAMALRADANTIQTADLLHLDKADGEISKDLGTCRNYKWNLAAAGIGLTSVLKNSAAAKTCVTATTTVDCTKNPYDASCAKVADCSKPENAQQTTCICQRNPTAAGCPGYTGSSMGMQAGGSRPSSGTSADDKSGIPTGVGGVDSTPIATTGSPGGLGSGGLGGGGSGAGGGGFGIGNGSQKPGGADGAKKDKALNANILGGFDGGGGGGGGSRSAASIPDSPYKAYVPGGDKAGKGGVQGYANGQITLSGSKDNFAKVREQAILQTPSLLAP